MLRYIILGLLFMLFSTEAFSEGNLAPIFQTESQAIKDGCKIKKLKTTNAKNCIIETFNGQELFLVIYDSNEQDKYIKAEQIKVTSWYNEAKVSYEDLLGNGTDFILVEFEGNRGTGTSQKILAIIGWHEDRFVPVLIESLSYYIEERDLLTDLNVNYKIENKGSPKITINLSYSYSQKIHNKTIKEKWIDSLPWNEATFSFYDKKNEQKKLSTSNFSLQKNISELRVRLVEPILHITDLDIDTLRQIRIMEILD